MATFTPSGDIVRGAPIVVVFVRPTLDASWIAAPYIYCDRLETNASPGVSQGTFVYRAGYGIQIGDTTYGVHTPTSIDQWQIKADMYYADGTYFASWFGIVVADEREREGSFINPNKRTDRVASQWQTFIAYGMEYLLQTTRIFGSYVTNDGVETEVLKRGLVFNGGKSQGRVTTAESQPNRSNNPIGTSGSYVFTHKLNKATAKEWSVSDIANYLAANHKPTVGGIEVPIKAAPGSAVIDWQSPIVELHGRYLKDIFDELYNRQRFCSYVVGWDDTQKALLIRVFTFSSTQVNLGAGGIIPANSATVDFDIDSAFDIENVEVHRVSNFGASQVVIIGAKRGCVFTVSPKDLNLAAGWTTQDGDDYEDAATGEAGYSGWDDGEKIKANALARSKAGAAKAWRDFVIAENWDFKSGDGQATIPAASRKPICPVLNDGDEPTLESETFWRPGLVIEDYLPLVEGVDYTGTLPVETNDDENAPEKREILVAVLMPDTANRTDDQWVKGTQIAGASPAELSAGQTWSLRARAMRDRCGLRLDVVGSSIPQHIIAGDDFSAVETTLDFEPTIDYQTDILVTCYMQADAPVYIGYPKEVPSWAANRRVVVIEDRKRRLDYIAPRTIVDVNPGGDLASQVQGGFIRDDRDEMKRDAQAAWEWYNRLRQALSITFKQITPLVEVGYLVLTIGGGTTQETINTPVTSILLEFGHKGSPHHAPRMTIRTDWGETEQTITRQNG